jgi:hypothetical protein
MAPSLWLALVMLLWPASVYVPSHIVFKQVFPSSRTPPNRGLQPTAASGIMSRRG